MTVIHNNSVGLNFDDLVQTKPDPLYPGSRQIIRAEAKCLSILFEAKKTINNSGLELLAMLQCGWSVSP